MRYVVLTTKHHEGFCLWDSALTDYSVTATPYGRDLIGPFVEAVRAAGLKVGFYHSLLDWHHPDFAVDDFHPLRNRGDVADLNAGKDRDIAVSRIPPWPGPGAPDQVRQDRLHVLRLLLRGRHDP